MRLHGKLLFAFAVLTFTAHSQLSIKAPAICHDANGYLRCFDDGDYIITFTNGNFTKYKTRDGSFYYTDQDRTITFIRNRRTADKTDTVKIQLLKEGLLLKKENRQLQIDSTKHLLDRVTDFHIYAITTNDYVSGFNFYAGNRSFEVRLETWGDWRWDIKMRDEEKRFAIVYTGSKNTRLQFIFIDNDRLRYGWSFGTTFKSSKKLSRLEAAYIDSVDLIGESPVIGRIKLDKEYYYPYNRSGKLDVKNMTGDLKLCDCQE